MKDEHVLMLLAGVALVALLVYKFAPGLVGADSSDYSVPSSSAAGTPDNVAGSIDPYTANPNGPWYLTFAQRYLFAAPVSMYVPGVTEGQVGQTDLATQQNSNWVGT